MEKKKQYEAPVVTRVRLDVKEAVLGYCQQTPDWVISPNCDPPISSCPSKP